MKYIKVKVNESMVIKWKWKEHINLQYGEAN